MKAEQFSVCFCVIALLMPALVPGASNAHEEDPNVAVSEQAPVFPQTGEAVDCLEELHAYLLEHDETYPTVGRWRRVSDMAGYIASRYLFKGWKIAAILDNAPEKVGGRVWDYWFAIALRARLTFEAGGFGALVLQDQGAEPIALDHPSLNSLRTATSFVEGEVRRN